MDLKKELDIDREAFNRLLNWLDKDRDQAGKKYEEIRADLIRVLGTRGCPVADELADEVIDRVTRKIEQITSDYVGKPEFYFKGVAQKVHLEYLRRRHIELPLTPAKSTRELEQQYRCLEKCLRQLTPKNRKMILKYYQQERHTKIEGRRKLAQQLGLAPNALRIRAHRIREVLGMCVAECIERKSIE